MTGKNAHLYSIGAIVCAVILAVLSGTTRSALSDDSRSSAARHALTRTTWMSPKAISEAKTTGLLFVADNMNSVVDVFSLNHRAKPIGVIVNLIGGPTVLAADASGDLFVKNLAANNVLEFTPPYNRPPVRVYYGQNGGGGLTVGADGTLYVSSQFGLNMVEYAKGSTTPKVIALPTGPVGVALDSKNNLFATYSSQFSAGGGVFELTSDYELSNTPINPRNLLIALSSQPRDLAFDAAGNMIVEDGTAAIINVYRPGTRVPYRTIGNGLVNPYSMRLGPGGNTLYVGDIGANDVQVINYKTGKTDYTLRGFGEVTGVAVTAPSRQQ